MVKKLDLGTPVKKGNVVKSSINTKKKESGDTVDLNFKVSPEFKREFKLWAASHEMSQKAVLEAGFSSLKETKI